MRPILRLGLVALAITLALGAAVLFPPAAESPEPAVAVPPQPAATATQVLARSAPTATPLLAPTPTRPARSSPTPTPHLARSHLEDCTLLAISGQGFGASPWAGRLDGYAGFADMASDLAHFVPPLLDLSSGQTVLPALLLRPSPLGGSPWPSDLVRTYVEPARARGWLVVLELPVGTSDLASQVRRLIDLGYLDYDNVGVALTPEPPPVNGVTGAPVQALAAEKIDRVQEMLDEQVRDLWLQHRKILIVRDPGGPSRTAGERSALETFENVDLVIASAGSGTPEAKVEEYNRLGDAYPLVAGRGITLFLPSPSGQGESLDEPILSWPQVLGLAPVGGLRVGQRPSVIIVD